MPCCQYDVQEDDPYLNIQKTELQDSRKAGDYMDINKIKRCAIYVRVRKH